MWQSNDSLSLFCVQEPQLYRIGHNIAIKAPIVRMDARINSHEITGSGAERPR
jgi:hypothetical protein